MPMQMPWAWASGDGQRRLSAWLAASVCCVIGLETGKWSVEYSSIDR